MTTYAHTVRHDGDHRFPRWSIFRCVKCGKRFEVHDTEALDFVAPKADCPRMNAPRPVKAS